MQYGTLNQPATKQPPGLRTTQKWSIVAAVFSIILEVIALVGFVPMATSWLFKGFGVAGVVFGVIGIVVSILLMVPACMTEPQAADKWRMMSLPFIIFHLINILFNMAYNFFFLGVHKSADLDSGNVIALSGAILIFVVDIGMSVVLITIAIYMLKEIKLQGQGLINTADNL